LIQAQHQNGLDVSLISTYQSRDNLSLLEDLSSQGIPITLIGPTYTPWRFSSELNSILKQKTAAVDLLHMHGVFEAIHFKASNLGIPFILRPCGMLSFYSLNKKKIKKRIYLNLVQRSLIKKAAAIHCTSQHEQDTLPSSIDRNKCFILSNGINLNARPCNSEFDLKSLGIEQNGFILYLSRIAPKKRPDLLIRSLNFLAPEDRKLVIAGPEDRAYGQQIRELVKQLRLEDSVLFVGEMDDGQKTSLLQKAKCLVLPSEHENFANVILEAAREGLYSIVSKHVALAEFISTNNLGAIAELEPNAIARAITEVPPTKLSIEQASTILTPHSLTKISCELTEFYHNLVPK
jgi:glycosyltransferase involved in cell wall biosynthesis